MSQCLVAKGIESKEIKEALIVDMVGVGEGRKIGFLPDLVGWTSVMVAAKVG